MRGGGTLFLLPEHTYHALLCHAPHVQAHADYVQNDSVSLPDLALCCCAWLGASFQRHLPFVSLLPAQCCEGGTVVQPVKIGSEG